MQKVPMFYVDGKEMTQSAAITRFLGRGFGLVTSYEFMNYRIDQICEVVKDGFLMWHKIVEEDSRKEVEKIKLKLKNNLYPGILRHLSDLVGLTEGPFIAGSQVTYGDFVLANWLQIWEKTISADLLDNYPILAQHKQSVLGLPEINNWIKIRPLTDL